MTKQNSDFFANSNNNNWIDGMYKSSFQALISLELQQCKYIPSRMNGVKCMPTIQCVAAVLIHPCKLADACWDVIQAHWMLWDLCVALLRMQTVLHRDLKASNVLECLLLWMKEWPSPSDPLLRLLAAHHQMQYCCHSEQQAASFQDAEPRLIACLHALISKKNELESWRVCRLFHYMVWPFYAAKY